MLVPLLEWHHRAIALARKFDSAVKGTIGDEYGSYPVTLQVAHGLFTHLARTNDHRRFVFQVIENTAGEIDRRRANGHRLGRHAGLTAYPFCHREGLVKAAMQHDSEGAEGVRRGVGIFDLSENLWFPNYHRV